MTFKKQVNVLTKPLGISLRQLALRLGRDKGGLSRAARDGRIPRLPDGTFDEDAVRAALNEVAPAPVDEPPLGPVDEAESQHPIVNAPEPQVSPKEMASLVRRTLAEEGQALDDGDLTLNHVRMTIGILKAREQATANELRAGQVVDLNVISDVLSKALTSTRTRLLGIASKVAPMVAVETDPVVVKEIVDDAIFEALTEISSPNFLDCLPESE